MESRSRGRAHSSKNRGSSGFEIAQITQRNEIKMREMVIKAKENAKSGKPDNEFDHHRQCRFCFEEQYLNRLAVT